MVIMIEVDYYNFDLILQTGVLFDKPDAFMTSVLWWVYWCTEIIEAQFRWRCEARESEFTSLQVNVTTF